MKKIVLGLMACAALCACTSDDLVSGVSTQKTFEGDVAYMTVRLKDVGTGTRATSPAADDGFGVATSDEYSVSDAYFYFYDGNGDYVSNAEVWDGGSVNGSSTNIDFDGSTVIILKGLIGKGYPKYVVTVLNRPSGFTPGETLDEMAAKLSETAALGIRNASNNFVMSTSSYVGTSDYYFVTELTEDDFYEEPVSENISTVSAVDIYVERLAAKIQVGVNSSFATTQLSDGTYGYKLTVGDEDYYVRIKGWNLNGTTKRSLMMKDIAGLNTSGVDGWTTWNDATHYRSYWGKSYNYGVSENFPTTSAGATDGTGLSKYLDYVSYNDLTLPVESSAINYTYCAENTNTAAILGDKYSTGITNVIIGAEICDIDGSPLELIRYNGELFKEDDYLDYVMSYLTSVKSLNVYVSAGGGSYTPIDGSYIVLESSTSSVDGYAKVSVNSSAFAGGTFYSVTSGVATELTVDDAVAAVTAALASSPFNTTSYANFYACGMMYYNIPIEHLNDANSNELLEANYGIVRNHWYQLTINSFSDLGKGVYNPNEVIIPNENDDILYYVGADLHILSWKLVQQSVDL